MISKGTMGRLAAAIAAAVALTPVAGSADNDFNNLQLLTQSQFETLSENLVAATAYKALAPAESLGALGFDIGLSISGTEIDEDIFDLASQGGWDLSTLPIPRLHVQKGLPMNVDVGAFYTGVPGSDIRFWGAELKYAFVPGGIATPAVAFRAAYSKLEGVDEIDLSNRSIELTVSKGFAMLTPYAGVGRIYSDVEAVDVATLDSEEPELNRVYVGLNINLGMNLVVEADKTGDYTTYSAKVGIRF